MVEIQKMDLKSKDLKMEHIERLKALFPEIVADDKINFEQLKVTLGEDIESSKERYGTTWAGKSNCFKIIQDRSIGTLKPAKDESVNFDTTKNLFIEGDNLEVLKLLQKSYYEKIKMIYIDPPYNTGNDFVYNDKFGQELEEYLKITGQLGENGEKLSTNTDASGRYHSAWMNMMYPRLFLARNLLTENGVIFISIDDNEITNLRKICDEIFGEQNFLAHINRVCIKGGSKSDAKLFIPDNDYVIVYAKNVSAVTINKLQKTDTQNYSLEDNKGFYKLRGLEMGGGGADTLKDRPKMGYSIYFNPKTNDYQFLHDYDLKKNPVYEEPSEELLKKGYVCVRPGKVRGELGRWRWSKEYFLENIDDVYIDVNKERAFTKDRKKDFIEMPPNCNLDIINTKGTVEVGNIFEGKIFDFPKPVDLLKHLIKIGMDKKDVILDFFAGSGTTAHALLDLNKEDGGSRKFICVQLPEHTDKSSTAYKAGYKTIADISKERIRRVIKKIEEESKQQKLTNDKKVDLGFRVFKLDKSNFKIWDSKVDDVQTALTQHVDQIKKGSNTDAVLYELLLKDGLELTTNIKKIELAGKTVYSIEDNMLLICLEEKLTMDLFKKMKELKPHMVIVLDKGFNNNDQLKTNAVELMTYVDKDTDRKEFILRSV